MRVPDVVLKSVGFVTEYCGADLSTEDFIGTAFIVSIPARTLKNYRFHYVVTARHVLNEKPNTKIAVSVNSAGGGVKFLDFQFESWFFHPDPNVDVAVMPYVWQKSDDISAFGLEDSFDDKKREYIGVGDEVFFPGLFIHAPGSTQRITPIVRHGHLALLPYEEIQIGDGFAHAYIIEARSIGGISGSPVFVRETIELRVTRDDGRVALSRGLGEMKLLGMIQGHWDINESEKNEPQYIHSKHGVNLGLAVVTPAARILETVNNPGLMQLREGVEQLKMADSWGTNERT